MTERGAAFSQKTITKGDIMTTVPVVQEESFSQATSKFQFHTFGPKPPAYDLSTQPKETQNSSVMQHPFQNKYSINQRFTKDLLSPKMEQDSASFSMHIPDEQKQPVVNTTYSDPKEWRPSNQSQPNEPQAHSQNEIPTFSDIQQEKSIKSIVRSKTAIDLAAKRRSTPIVSATLSTKKASPRSKRMTLESSSRQNSSNNVSPRRYTGYTGSTGKYYEEKVDKIFENSVPNTARTTYNRTGGTSSTNASPLTGRRSSSPFSDSPLKTLHSGRINKNDPRMKSLKGLKLLGKDHEGAFGGAQTGLSLVRETLDSVLDERQQFQGLNALLKQAIKAEKDSLAKHCENIKILANQMQRLDKNNNHLDQSSLNNQALINTTREKAIFLQTEVLTLNEKLSKMNKQIEIEKDVVGYLTNKTKELKICHLELTKAKDELKDETEISRNEKNKCLEKYEEACFLRKRILTTMEDNFRRYAVEN